MNDESRNDLPIGIFDSGVGGLTVLQAIRDALPEENLVYLGDTARLPYGTKSPASIARYAVQAATKLCEQGIKLLVVACNTAGRQRCRRSAAGRGTPRARDGSDRPARRLPQRHRGTRRAGDGVRTGLRDARIPRGRGLERWRYRTCHRQALSRRGEPGTTRHDHPWLPRACAARAGALANCRCWRPTAQPASRALADNSSARP